MSKVWIVGGGCGALDLLTLRGKACIEHADCILYDRLIDPTLLTYAKSDCECLYVGKTGHGDSVSQTEIHEVLLQKAQQYECVVRLKGGDPYVFGRGGEEALFLKQHHIPFEVVPGISSAIGGLSYAGIPVSHRTIARGFRVYTAFSDEKKTTHLDFKEMAKSEDTLVFLMGLSSLSYIVEQLLFFGMQKDMPIALASQLSTPNQVVVTGTLTTILQKDISTIQSPTVIVVGKVVELHTELNTYQKKRLFGKRYCVATLEHTPSIITKQLRDEGAFVQEAWVGECQRIQKPFTSIDFTTITHIIFCSKRCIDMMMESLFEVGYDIRTIAHCKFCCIGLKTKQHLAQYGIQADMCPAIYDSEHVVDLLKDTLHGSEHICIPKAMNDNTYLQDHLMKYCRVTVLPIYTIEEKAYSLPSVYDGILCTCSYHVHSLMKKDIQKEQCFISIGKRTTNTLKSYGYENIIEAKTADYSAMIEAICQEEKNV